MPVPSTSAPAKAAVGRSSRARSRPPSRQASSTRNANQSVVTTITWKLVSGWPPRNCRPTSAASAAASSGSGRRTSSSVTSSSHGISGKMLVSGHASQTTKNVPNANTTPASSAPPKRMPKRPREQVHAERAHEQLEHGDHGQRFPQPEYVQRAP